MDQSNRNTAIAAAIILLAFGLGAYLLPSAVIALGEVSPYAGGLLAVAFVASFFGLFWLRGRFKR